MLDMALIERAAAYLHDKVRRTPVEPSPGLTERLGAPCHLKLESLQITGSFKIRGAWFRLSLLSEAERRRGVATCSAGNHGKAVAFAARALGIRARIYVPRSVDAAKYEGMVAQGAEVIRSDSNFYDETEAWARAQATEHGLPFVSAFEDEAVMAGNGGSLALEILEQVPEVRNIIIPVSGGGMAAGVVTVFGERVPDGQVLACQHAQSPSLALSLERGEAVTQLPGIDTLAGGIEGGIGAANFEIIEHAIRHVALLSEQQLYEGVAWMLQEHQYLVEPSSAATVAACLSGELPPLRGPTLVVLSGRNVSLSSLRTVLAGT